MKGREKAGKSPASLKDFWVVQAVFDSAISKNRVEYESLCLT